MRRSCDGQCRSIVVEYRSVQSALVKKAARHKAPPYLGVRVRDRIESPARPGFWESVKAVFSRRPVALAAAFVIIVVSLWVLPSDRGGYVVASEVTRQCFEGHGRCADSAFLSQHIQTDQPAVLSRALTVRAGYDVKVPDLSAAGCTLVEVTSSFSEPRNITL